jgi:hypothetical protein
MTKLRINEKGQCPVCLRKPLRYTGRQRRTERQFFCCKCDRSFNLDTGVQMENFAWKKMEGSEEFGRVRAVCVCGDWQDKHDAGHGICNVCVELRRTVQGPACQRYTYSHSEPRLEPAA